MGHNIYRLTTISMLAKQANIRLDFVANQFPLPNFNSPFRASAKLYCSVPCMVVLWYNFPLTLKGFLHRLQGFQNVGLCFHGGPTQYLFSMSFWWLRKWKRFFARNPQIHKAQMLIYSTTMVLQKMDYYIVQASFSSAFQKNMPGCKMH